MKKDLTAMTFCIPIRIESDYRRRNLVCLLSYITRYFDTSILILEADKKRRFVTETSSPIRYLFIEDHAEVFHRTQYINRMLSLVETPFAAIWDTDAIAPAKQIYAGYEALRDHGATLVYPYSGLFIAVCESMSAIFRSTLNIEMLQSPYLHRNLLNGYYAVGGAYMVSVERYQAAGGENEFFYGWGPEDMERKARLEILEHRIVRIEGLLYHLYHTRGINSNYATPKLAIRSKAEFCKICGMDKKELERYIGMWHA